MVKYNNHNSIRRMNSEATTIRLLQELFDVPVLFPDFPRKHEYKGTIQGIPVKIGFSWDKGGYYCARNEQESRKLKEIILDFLCRETF